MYQYDAKDKLSNFIDPYNYPIKFVYDANNRLIKINYYFDFNEANVVATEQIEYNAKGQWSKITYAETGDINKTERTYEYDANGNRTMINFFKDGKRQWSYAYEYTNGNLAELKYIDDANRHGTSFVFEYDTSRENKLAKFEETMHVGFSSYGFGNIWTPSKNMIKKINLKETGGPTVFYASYTYEYNDKGYPTKLTTFTDDVNQDGLKNDPASFVYEYTYQCK
ncbi:hypothetical protein AAE02nite_46470 [Adhaeribacter aerolatus]|uniref:Type IV secretion protein Rhs n=1 Tax=Adhaeribacter aerolatus TaxID=670289 RepID=A0A512B4T4_9BACT|nr:hypothetical protein [Adhaeribacter aerolatus]GEO06983.1 hypothetical protein AAE02nite_46470 [Adhaeribacter aerolatus]